MLFEQLGQLCGVVGELGVVAFDVGNQILGQTLANLIGSGDRTQTTQHCGGLRRSQIGRYSAGQQLAQQRM